MEDCAGYIIVESVLVFLFERVCWKHAPAVLFGQTFGSTIFGAILLVHVRN